MCSLLNSVCIGKYIQLKGQSDIAQQIGHLLCVQRTLTQVQSPAFLYGPLSTTQTISPPNKRKEQAREDSTRVKALACILPAQIHPWDPISTVEITPHCSMRSSFWAPKSGLVPNQSQITNKEQSENINKKGHTGIKWSQPIKRPEQWEWRNSTANMVLALHTTDLSSIPTTHIILCAL